MNKFVSFEMVFNNGQKFMGNKIMSFDFIGGEEDIKFLEEQIRCDLNKGQDLVDYVDIVTITNWKAL